MHGMGCSSDAGRTGYLLGRALPWSGAGDRALPCAVSMHGWSELFANGRGRVLLFCWLGWTFDLCDLLLFSFTKPQIAKDLGLELYGPGPGIAWIEGLGLFATAVGGFCCGRLADRIG